MTKRKRQGRRTGKTTQGRFNLSIAPDLISKLKIRAGDLGLDVNQYLGALAKRDIARGGELALLPAMRAHGAAFTWEEFLKAIDKVCGVSRGLEPSFRSEVSGETAKKKIEIPERLAGIIQHLLETPESKLWMHLADGQLVMVDDIPENQRVDQLADTCLRLHLYAYFIEAFQSMKGGRAGGKIINLIEALADALPAMAERLKSAN